MRFDTSIDRWRLALVVAEVALTSIPLLQFGLRVAAEIVALFWILGFATLLPQYYELQPTGLFIRRGWRTKLIPYDTLVEVCPTSNPRGVFSHDALRVTTATRQVLAASPKDPELFFGQLLQLAPNLERSGIGVRVPFAPIMIE